MPVHHINLNTYFAAAFGVFSGGSFFFKGIGTWREKRFIQNRPLSKIRSVAMGEVELSGEVKSLKTLKAPYSGLDCVCYRYKIEVPEKNGWRQIGSGGDQCIFKLDDGTGQILVNPEKAEFFGPDTYQAINPDTQTFVNQTGSSILKLNITMNSRQRVTEQAVLPGQIVFVEGDISKVRTITNGREAEENMVSCRPGGKMILSAYSEETLLSRFTWQAPLQIFGGAALVLGCLYYLTTIQDFFRLLNF